MNYFSSFRCFFKKEMKMIFLFNALEFYFISFFLALGFELKIGTTTVENYVLFLYFSEHYWSKRTFGRGFMWFDFHNREIPISFLRIHCFIPHVLRKLDPRQQNILVSILDFLKILKIRLRDHPFKTAAHFHSRRQFFATIGRKIWPIFDPSP